MKSFWKKIDLFCHTLIFNYWRQLEDTNKSNIEYSKRQRNGIFTRLIIIVFFTIVGYFLLGTFLEHVQVDKHEYYTKKSRQICQRENIIRPARGTIYDLNGNVLAIDKATLDVFAEPKRFISHIDEAAKIMSKYLHLEYRELKAHFLKVANYHFPVEITDKATMDQMQSSGILTMPGIDVTPQIGQDGLPNGLYLVKYYPENASKVQRREAIKVFCSNYDWEKQRLESQISRQIERCKEISIKWQAPQEDVEKMLQELRNAKIRGVRVLESWERTYPRNNQLANILGFLDISQVGVSGVEALMNDYLTPILGRATYIHDRRGRPIGGTEEIQIEPQNGADVYLTIIEPLQTIAEEELKAMVEKNNPQHAYIIMIEPSTGAIMALAQYPQFNPNDRASLSNAGDCQNHCILQTYEPGSMMKPISLSGLVDSHKATMDTVVFCENGRWRYAGRTLRDGTHRYENLTLAEVIIKSSNIGTAKLALDWGDDNVYNHMSKFLLGRKTGLGFYPDDNTSPRVFTSESRGIYRPLHEWKTDKLKITRVPIGQGVSCTPMQIVQAWSAFANDGVIMQPHIVDRVIYPDGRLIQSRTFAKAQPISEETCLAMRPALMQVATPDGTARRAAVKGYKVAGKTGTAQIWINGNPQTGEKGHYSEKQYLASFVGYAPAEDPKFLVLVSAESPTSVEHTGSNVAAPVFSKVVARTLEFLQIPPTEEIKTK